MQREHEAQAPATTFNILFVCTGNTCRSPMAEALARAEVARRGWRHVRVESAGSTAAKGEPAAEPAVAVAGKRGLDLRHHRSRLLDAEMVEWADVILCMGAAHVAAAERLGGGEKAALLATFASEDGGSGFGVPDPFGGDEEEYEQTLAELQLLVSSALDRIAPVVNP